jgi:Zn-dependent protease/CBS domain-containing protein
MDTPRGGIKLGTFVGAPVILSPTWFLVGAFVVFTFGPSVRNYLPELSRGQDYVVAATYAVLLLVSVLVHELAHAILARAYGLPVTRIVADVWGGHTQFASEASHPLPSAVVSVGGPAANLALAVVGLAVRDASNGGVVELLGNALYISNLLLALFNLLPGLPLDGGRVVESAFWAISRQRSTGTLVAGWCGRVVAVAVLFLGVFLPFYENGSPDATLLVWSALIAGLLWTGATQALQWGGMRRKAGQLDARRLARPAVPVHSSWTLAEVSDLAVRQGVSDIVVLDPSGVPFGLVALAAIQQVIDAGHPDTEVQALMHALPPYAVVPATTTGEALLQLLSQTPATGTYALVDDQGRVGLVTGRDLVEAMGARSRS